MARVTVEDCLEYCENRFDLVLKAAARAHRLELGQAEPMVPVDNDKPAVVALREIAAGFDVTQDETEERSRQEENALVERFLGEKPVSTLGYQDDLDAQEVASYTENLMAPDSFLSGSSSEESKDDAADSSADADQEKKDEAEGESESES